MRQWQPNDLFWIVGNGFKYTGMPTGSRSSARTRFGPSSHFSLRSKNSTRRLIGISRSAMSICPKQAVPSLRHSSPSPGRLRLAPGATAMKANGRRATSCGSCTASRPIISSPRSRPMPKANGEAESCNHWRRISPRRICVSSRTIMRVFPHPQMPSTSADAAVAERGRKLVVEGVPSANVPPCATCHSNVGP